MSTSSTIGILNVDGTVQTIYCHFDGYPTGVGKTLEDHYKTEEKVRALIALGDISSLGEEIGEKHDFDKRVPKWVNAYGRDRGESDVDAIKHRNLQAAKQNSCSYFYLFDTSNTSWRRIK